MQEMDQVITFRSVFHWRVHIASDIEVEFVSSCIQVLFAVAICSAKDHITGIAGIQ